MLCAVRGCDNPSTIGTCLCSTHLEQVRITYESICDTMKELNNKLNNKEIDRYNIAVTEYTSKIMLSEQMRSLTAELVEGGVRDAIDFFPGLALIPQEIIEQLASFMAISVVSSIIQERAHLLARALMLTESLSSEQAVGIHKMIEFEMESLEKSIKEDR